MVRCVLVEDVVIFFVGFPVLDRVVFLNWPSAPIRLDPALDQCAGNHVQGRIDVLTAHGLQEGHPVVLALIATRSRWRAIPWSGCSYPVVGMVSGRVPWPVPCRRSARVASRGRHGNADAPRPDALLEVNIA